MSLPVSAIQIRVGYFQICFPIEELEAVDLNPDSKQITIFLQKGTIKVIHFKASGSVDRYEALAGFLQTRAWFIFKIGSSRLMAFDLAKVQSIALDRYLSFTTTNQTYHHTRESTSEMESIYSESMKGLALSRMKTQSNALPPIKLPSSDQKISLCSKFNIPESIIKTFEFPTEFLQLCEPSATKKGVYLSMPLCETLLV